MDEGFDFTAPCRRSVWDAHGVADIGWGRGHGHYHDAVTTTAIDWNRKPAIGSQLTTQIIPTAAAYTFAVTQMTVSNDTPTSFNTKENAGNKPTLVLSAQ
jgi:hypothetical protein